MRHEGTADHRWYPAVMALVDELARGVPAILGESAVGMYLHGSLASGEFNPDRSDIDVMILTAGEVDGAAVTALGAMHGGLALTAPPWGRRLEVVYLPVDELGSPEPSARRAVPSLHVGEGFQVKPIGPGFVIQLHVLREHGRTIFGPDPKRVIRPASVAALRHAQVALLHEWWAPQLPDDARLRDREYQAYAVLTMCRALYLLETGAVASKPAAARWAQQHTAGDWAGLIERALAWPHGGIDDERPQTIEYIKFALARTTDPLPPRPDPPR